MRRTQGREQEKAAFLRAAEAMYEELCAWRAQHLEASFDEIAAQVTPRRRALMGQLLKQLAQEADERVAAPVCEECGAVMRYKGRPERGVSHGEGEMRLARAYYFHNRHRMDYAAYRQAGLPIGSGTIESACKTVVQARMKQAGMRWSREGAQAMLALRCLLLSNRWHELAAPP